MKILQLFCSLPGKSLVFEQKIRVEEKLEIGVVSCNFFNSQLSKLGNWNGHEINNFSFVPLYLMSDVIKPYLYPKYLQKTSLLGLKELCYNY